MHQEVYSLPAYRKIYSHCYWKLSPVEGRQGGHFIYQKFIWLVHAESQSGLHLGPVWPFKGFCQQYFQVNLSTRTSNDDTRKNVGYAKCSVSVYCYETSCYSTAIELYRDWWWQGDSNLLYVIVNHNHRHLAVFLEWLVFYR